MEEKNYFEKLSALNVSDKVEKKNGLSYLSWAWAWAETKKIFPLATYKVYENTLPNGYVVNYFTDGSTSYVKVGVVINDIEHIEMLPVMDYRNKSIKLELMTSFDVNTAIQRCLTKAIARHGLGLYIYAGEDLPEEEEKPVEIKKPTQVATAPQQDTHTKILNVCKKWLLEHPSKVDGVMAYVAQKWGRDNLEALTTDQLANLNLLMNKS